MKQTLCIIGLAGIVVLGRGTAVLGLPPISNAPSTGRVTSLPLSTSLDRIQAGSPQADTTYTLGSGDKVRVDVFRMPQYSGENTVLADGTLSLVQIGNVNVTGLTLEQAAAEISQQNYFQNFM